MKPKLSILIPTTPDRQETLNKLYEQFREQLGDGFTTEFDTSTWESFKIYKYMWYYVEVIIFQDNKQHSIGAKRNELLNVAKGDYVAFIDSDDRISDNYFEKLFEGINKDVDCCSLTGIITEDSQNPLMFQHSIKYRQYKTNPESEPIRYERYPNHLNCIRASIAKKYVFPDVNHSEDTNWATQITGARALKTEHWIEDVIYYYDYRSKK